MPAARETKSDRTAEEGQQQRPGERNGHRAQHEGAPPSEPEREATGEGMVSRPMRRELAGRALSFINAYPG